MFTQPQRATIAQAIEKLQAAEQALAQAAAALEECGEIGARSQVIAEQMNVAELASGLA